MRETFNELDLTSELIEISMSEEEPNFSLSTHGYTGTTQVMTDYKKQQEYTMLLCTLASRESNRFNDLIISV